MNVFELIKTVLDEIYQEIPGDSQIEKDQAVSAALGYLRVRYNQLRTETEPIDYRDPANRFAYVYKYVTSHANLVKGLIETHQPLRDLFQRERLTVASLGGGPGSDLIGILKYMQSRGLTTSLKCFLLDREKAWSDSWSDIDDKTNHNSHLSTYFTDLDVTDPSSWSIHRKYYQCDLVTLTYFVSELYTLRDQCTEYFAELFAQTAPGTLFLCIDNSTNDFWQWFDNLATQANLKVLATGETRKVVPPDEQKLTLGEYLNRFESPKLQAYITYRVYEKQEVDFADLV